MRVLAWLWRRRAERAFIATAAHRIVHASLRPCVVPMTFLEGAQALQERCKQAGIDLSLDKALSAVARAHKAILRDMRRAR